VKRFRGRRRSGEGRGGAARAARRGASGLARIITTIAGIVATAIVIGILLVVLRRIATTAS
jgi:hypothetical protein